MFTILVILLVCFIVGCLFMAALDLLWKAIVFLFWLYIAYLIFKWALKRFFNIYI
jgi:hypothetical protein